MATKMLAVSGSMREGSHSAKGLKILLDHAKEMGAETRFLDLRVLDLPMYNSPSSSGSKSLREANEATEWADVIVLGTPDYHGSMSGALKNYLDYHWEEFAGKLFGYICASHEKGLTVMDQMRTAVRQCYGWSLPYGISFDGKEVFNVEGTIIQPKIEQRLRMMARDLTVYGSLLRDQFTKDLLGDFQDTFAARYR